MVASLDGGITMMRRRLVPSAACAMLAALAATCSQQPPVDLATSLKGIDKARFLTCSGPPLLETSEGGQDRMMFLSNLKRGQAIGIGSPADGPDASCSVNAVFQNDRLVSSDFSGNPSMCTLVFSPCLQK
jgi:hypothetical protein